MYQTRDYRLRLEIFFFIKKTNCLNKMILEYSCIDIKIRELKKALLMMLVS